MYRYLYNPHGFFFGDLFNILFLILLAVLIYFLIKKISQTNDKNKEGKEAFNLLDHRYVKGEISEKEYLKMKKVLNQ